MFKKIYNKIIAYILLLGLFFNLPLVVYGETQTEVDIQHVETFAQNLGVNIDVDSIYELYNINGDVIAYLCTIKSSGYVIVSVDDVIIEANFTQNITTIYDEMFYFGPYAMYYRDDIGQLVNIFDGSILSTSDYEIVYASDLYEEGSLRERDVLISDYINESLALYTEEGTWGYGICGTVAASIFFKYYDQHKYNGTLLPSSLTSDASGVTLMNKVMEYVNPEHSGSSLSEQVVGMNYFTSYLGKNSQLNVVGSTSNLFSTYKEYIGYSDPVIVNINNNTYGNHWVVGYGYYVESGSSSVYNYICISDGRGAYAVVNTVYMQSIVHKNYY